MKLILHILFFSLFLRDILTSTCIETFVESERDYYDFYYEEYMSSTQSPSKESSTVTCTNVSSLTDLPLPPIYFDTSVSQKQILIINQSAISIIPKEALSRFYPISKLYLSGIHIKRIESGAFENLTQLRELFLENNDIKELEDDLFAPLTKLERLDLSNNIITHIKENIFKNLNNLEYLNLEHNSITRIEDGVLDSLPELRTLKLSGNPLKNFPEKAKSNWSNSTLNTLEISDALITKFDVDLLINNMYYLNFSSNQIQSFDFSRVPLTITLIDLSRNKITNISNFNPVEFSNVYLDHNLIKSLNGNFGAVSNLHISHNLIKDLESSPFKESKSLNQIDLSYNEISNVSKDAFLGLTYLEILRLNHNKINLIAVGTFKDLKYLRELDISHNNIQQFQFGMFEGLSNLKILDISDNQLSNLNEHAFYSFEKLSDLRIDSTLINSIDISTLSEHLKKLTRISVNNNNNNTLFCKKLVDLYHKLKLANLDLNLKSGNFFDVENFHGIPCVNKMEAVQVSTPSPKDFFRIFQKAVHKGVQESKIHTYLEDDFKNYTFFHYFNNSSRSSTTPIENRSDTLIATNVIQMILSLLLLFIVCLIWIMLLKYKRNVRSAFASHTQLYYKN